MAEPTFRTVSILRIFDVAKAKEFYVGFLGLQVDWEHRFEPDAPVYMQVSRGDLVLHLSEHHGDCSPGGCVHVRTTGLDEFHREITAKGYRFMRPGIQPTPWGSKLMEVIDPFHNRLSSTRIRRRGATAERRR
jgi:catechol 2,3-dioxygenase-like lactoylglutathione lyase family enzyme